MDTIISPFFLIGAERSGTTMLRLMLDHHPEIFFHHEFVYAVEKIDAEGKFPVMHDYLAYLESDRIFQSENICIPDSENYVGVVRSFLSQLYSRHSQKSIVGATVHRNFQFLTSIWPNAKFIHIVRDPRDVTFSYVKKGWAGHVWTAADVWLKIETAWQSFSQTLNSTRYITLFYEDLVAEPEKELNKLCQFMGVEYSDNMQNYANKSSFSSPDKSLINQWKKSDPKAIHVIEYKLEKLMKQYGYMDKQDKTIKVSYLYDYYLQFYSRINKLLFSIRRYGLSLRFLDFLSRRIIKIQKFRILIKEKMNVIDRLYIK